jgi:farnesyl-diphosphate farnesyltransferase
MASATQQELIGPLLKEVSRSFYLTLRVLPKEIRPQISLAYLLARATDTIADTKVVPRKRRLELLRQMQAGEIKAVAELVGPQALTAERTLLQRLDECCAMLKSFSEGDQKRIGDLWQTIINGQIFDLQRFPGELTALADEAELDRYTYLVAGCVGEFWTRMCAAHLPAWNPASTEELGIRFGKGLQLVNILRDIAEDRRRGRQYLPHLNDYQCWLDRTVAHLDAGWQYTMAIPANLWRLRLACTWPIWIGLETVALLRKANPLEADKRVMVPQGVVNRMLVRTLLTCRCSEALDNRYRQLRAKAG